MSRKRKAPKKIPIVDPRYKSVIIPKLINSIMYDGKKTIAEKIVYDAIDKIKSKSNEPALVLAATPINEFNQINIAPAAAASFSEPRPNIIIIGRRYIPPPIPIPQLQNLKHYQ